MYGAFCPSSIQNYMFRNDYFFLSFVMEHNFYNDHERKERQEKVLGPRSKCILVGRNKGCNFDCSLVQGKSGLCSPKSVPT